MEKNGSDLNAEFEAAHDLFRLPSIEELSDHELGTMFVRYFLVFHDHFVPWMILAWINSVGNVRKALAENLSCEIAEDHPEQLRRLVDPIISRLLSEDLRLNTLFSMKYKALKYAIEPIGAHPFYSVALLENLSIQFIPWMWQAAQKLTLHHQEYLDAHGKADIAHANNMKRAVAIFMLEQGLAGVPRELLLSEFRACSSHVLYALDWVFTGKEWRYERL